MANFCVITGKVRARGGSLVAGAVVTVASCLISGSRSSTYETSAITDSNGEFTFTIPQAAVLRFSSYDADIDGWTMTVPNAPTFDIGIFLATPASAVSAREIAVQAAVTPNTAVSGISVREYGNSACRKLVITLNNFLVTLVKNGTSTGGGGTKMVTFPVGLVLPLIASSDLTVAAAGDKSFLASIGHAAADTGGTLSSTEASVAPSTAATTTSGAGTCKMKSTSSVPTPGSPLDGTSTAISLYLNSALNADATGVEALYFTGTITVVAAHGGDN